MVSYKPEAVKAFEKIEKRFNETHDDIHLTISSPNEAMTILKTRFIREDYPDIIAIGGDINYSNFLDADLFEDISGLDEVQTVKQAYLDMDKELEFIPKDGTYALPYVANAAGILYNKDLFEQAGITEEPKTWDEFKDVCQKLKDAGIGTYILFQETYHKESYETLHPTGPKHNYAYHTEAMDRAMEIFDVHLEKKDGGKSGLFERSKEREQC